MTPEQRIKAVWDQLPEALRYALYHIAQGNPDVYLSLTATDLVFTLNDAVVRMDRLTIRKGVPS